MKKLRVLDLFSGIGGFSLGLERAGGFETVAFCEIEPFRREVLRKHWPDVPIYEDVRTLTADALRRDGIGVDAICGGFPCQDISGAGKRVGIEGERSGLWAEYARLVGEIRPRYVFVENVADLLALGLDRVLGDLAALRYDAEWDCIPAGALGAEHERDRFWMVAYPDEIDGQAGLGFQFDDQASLWAAQDRDRTSVWLAPPSVPARVGDGAADWLDRRARTEAIGDAVVPFIPEILGRAVMIARSTTQAQAAVAKTNLE